MIEHPCIDSEALEGREDDTGHSSGSEILLSRAQVTDLLLFTTFFPKKIMVKSWGMWPLCHEVGSGAELFYDEVGDCRWFVHDYVSDGL
jgi:hypothetical protein